MDAWAAFCEPLRSANVVAIGGSRNAPAKTLTLMEQ
jgi:hypothetical protein